MTPRFPDGFLWGTATAAHQVEGGNHMNDWWEWEQVRSRIKDGSSSDPACDHYSRFRSDFDLLRRLHQNAHRLSVEWSRIEPEAGRFSQEAIEHYREVLEALRERGIQPMVTLHHYSNPLWIAREGGWLNPAIVEHFKTYVARVFSELGELADLWVTINEPTGIAYQGYVLGEWPPGQKDASLAMRVLVNLLSAHWRAYEVIKEARPQAQVGLAHHLRIFDPARPLFPTDRLVAYAYDRVFNHRYIPSG